MKVLCVLTFSCTMSNIWSVLLLMLASLALGRAPDSLYSLSAVDIAGKEVSLSQYKGKLSLVVNVASECGYTDLNYRELVKLQNHYGRNIFNVLAFPCNQFGQQEPGTSDEILQFAKRYDVNFPLFSKVDVVGSGVSSVYRHLGTITGRIPKWNFCKYLVDGDGRVETFFQQDASFDAIRRAIDRLLLKQQRTEL